MGRGSAESNEGSGQGSSAYDRKIARAKAAARKLAGIDAAKAEAAAAAKAKEESAKIAASDPGGSAQNPDRIQSAPRPPAASRPGAPAGPQPEPEASQSFRPLERNSTNSQARSAVESTGSGAQRRSPGISGAAPRGGAFHQF